MWLECGCNAGAMREQRGDNPGVNWVQSGVKADAKRVQNGCKAGAHSYNSSSAFGLQIGFRNWKLEYWDFLGQDVKSALSIALLWLP